MVPVLGAASGALVNALFMQHFQEVAQGHFTVRRLERAHGADLVQATYRAIGEERAQRRAALVTAPSGA